MILPSLDSSSESDTTFNVFSMQTSTVGTAVAIGSCHGDVSLVRAPVLVLRTAGEDGDHSRVQAQHASGAQRYKLSRVVATSGSVTKKKLEVKLGTLRSDD
jgi:hypothetical protein